MHGWKNNDGAITMSQYPLADELMKRHNRYLIASVGSFVHENEVPPDHNMEKLQELAQQFYPIQEGVTIYRGTKVAADKLPHILSEDPFTLKADRAIRSWTANEWTARRFSQHLDEDNSIGLLLKGTTVAEEIIIDFSNKKIVEEFMEILDRVKFPENEEEIDADMAWELEPFRELRNGWYLLRQEQELFRLVKDRVYTLCDDILSISLRTQDHDVDLFDGLLNTGDFNQLKFNRKGYSLTTLNCENGKLTLEPL